MIVASLLLALSPALAQDSAATAPVYSTTVVYRANDAGYDGVAQDDDDDPLGGDPDTVRSEKEAVKKASSTTSEDGSDRSKRRVIKTIQKKNFMKLHRGEVGPFFGFVANDPFLNRYILNVVADYHLTEVFAIEAQLGYAPILGEGGEDDPDWKPLSKQLLLRNSVSPDISKLTAHGHLGLTYAPIYGKVAVGRSIINFDIYGGFGLGATQTTDDLVALQAQNEPDAIATQNQWHPTTVITVGARVAFTPTIAARIEGKSMSYIETVSSTTLEMKNNFILQLGATFFIPGMK